MKKLVVIFLLISNALFAQNAMIDTNSILIGQQINLTISNAVNKTTKWPIYNDTIISGVEIINSSGMDTAENIISQTFTITAWDSGSYYIPPIQFSENSKTSGILLNVNTVTLEEDAELKDIKQPMNAPIGWSEIWPWLLTIIVITLIIIILKKYVFGKKQNNIKIVPKVIIPADVIALKELDKLEKAKIWEKGDIKKYHTKLSEIIRRYTEDRFSFIALELTTYEIIEELSNKVTNDQLASISLLLQRADLAKFAKSKPSDSENIESMQLAKDFVNNTKIAQVLNSPNINYISEINKKTKGKAEPLNVRQNFLKNK